MSDLLELMKSVTDASRAAYNAGHEAGYKQAAREQAKRIEQLEEALQMFVKQWNACGPNSDFGRYFGNVRTAAIAALEVGT